MEANNPLDFHRCDVCGSYGTRSLSNILKHVREHPRKSHDHNYAKVDLSESKCYSNIPEVYKCEKCNFETNLKVSLTDHLNLNHEKLEERNKIIYRIILRQCDYCDFETYSMLLLLKHCSKCDKREGLGISQVYDKLTNWYECEQCSLRTKEKSNLRRHIINIHSTLRQCDRCEYKTTNRYELKKHISTVHVWYQCDKCEFKIKWRSDLKKHVERVHTNTAKIAWHQCEKCEFKTKRKYNFKLHIAAHTKKSSKNVTWYQCEKCVFSSKIKGKLTRHIENFHTDLAKIVWYRCDNNKCGYRTRKKSKLERHVEECHTGRPDSPADVWFHCKECTYKAKNKNTLERHEERHMSDFHTRTATKVWHRCNKCGYKAKSKSSLKKHIREEKYCQFATKLTDDMVWYDCNVNLQPNPSTPFSSIL